MPAARPRPAVRAVPPRVSSPTGCASRPAPPATNTADTTRTSAIRSAVSPSGRRSTRRARSAIPTAPSVPAVKSQRENVLSRVGPVATGSSPACGGARPAAGRGVPPGAARRDGPRRAGTLTRHTARAVI